MNNAIKGLLIAAGVLGSLVLLASCNSCRQDFKAYKSHTIGLTRTITLFDANGKAIKVWNTTSTYDNRGTGICFLDENEKFVGINGTFIIEEK